MRLEGYDYSTPGAYFVTVCTQSRLPLFGQIADGNMAANRLGAVVEDSWAEIPNHYHNISLDAFVLMPNHAHGVIIIEHGTSGLGASFKPALPTTMTSKRHGFPKSFGHSRHSQPAESIRCVQMPASPCGSVDSTTTSYGVRVN